MVVHDIKVYNLSLFISSPKQLENNIDVYLTLLLDDLHKLWTEDVEVWDAYLKEYFILRVIIFYMINDYPFYGNLLGFRIKTTKVCPTYGESTNLIHLK
jgi:Transposase family tnp2